MLDVVPSRQNEEVRSTLDASYIIGNLRQGGSVPG